MTNAALIETEEPAENGGIYKADHRQGLSWYCEWFDHAGRLIKRRLGTVRNVNEADVFDLAKQAVDVYLYQQEALWEERMTLTVDDIEERANQASFPREVVAREILRICERISRDGYEEARNGRPGLQLFADRVGISGREIHRIIEDPSRITVGIDVVDKICCEFDMVFEDFIASALEWASQTGSWSSRPGQQDAWPCGYTPLSLKPCHDII